MAHCTELSNAVGNLRPGSQLLSERPCLNLTQCTTLTCFPEKMRGRDANRLPTSSAAVLPRQAAVHRNRTPRLLVAAPRTRSHICTNSSSIPVGSPSRLAPPRGKRVTVVCHQHMRSTRGREGLTGQGSLVGLRQSLQHQIAWLADSPQVRMAVHDPVELVAVPRRACCAPTDYKLWTCIFSQGATICPVWHGKEREAVTPSSNVPRQHWQHMYSLAGLNSERKRNVGAESTSCSKNRSDTTKDLPKSC